MCLSSILHPYVLSPGAAALSAALGSMKETDGSNEIWAWDLWQAISLSISTTLVDAYISYFIY